MTPAILLVAMAQGTSIPPAQQSQMTSAFLIAEPNRLATTPKIDGVMENEEWDPLNLSGLLQSYFEWEPERVHIATKAAMGQDVLISLDLKGDGWHVGSDNLEVRLHWNGASTDVIARRADMTGAGGPVWVEANDYRAAMQIASVSDGTSWTSEMTIMDPGVPQIGKAPGAKLGVRVDGIFATDAPMEAFFPRVVPLVNLVWDRSAGLPAGLSYKTEYRGRTVMPGEDIKVRFAFDGQEGMSFKRADMRTEGLGRDFTASKGMPFPNFDRKKRAFIDYNTSIADGSPYGWRVARATVFDAQDQPFVVQSSYEIAPPVSFDFNDTNVKSAPNEQSVRLSTYIRSNTSKRVNGVFKVVPPLGWGIESGNEKPFALVSARASKRQVFTFKVPAGYKGVAPFKLVAEMGNYHAEKTVWLVVE